MEGRVGEDDVVVRMMEGVGRVVRKLMEWVMEWLLGVGGLEEDVEF